VATNLVSEALVGNAPRSIPKLLFISPALPKQLKFPTRFPFYLAGSIFFHARLFTDQLGKTKSHSIALPDVSSPGTLTNELLHTLGLEEEVIASPNLCPPPTMVPPQDKGRRHQRHPAE